MLPSPAARGKDAAAATTGQSPAHRSCKLPKLCQPHGLLVCQLYLQAAQILLPAAATASLTCHMTEPCKSTGHVLALTAKAILHVAATHTACLHSTLLSIALQERSCP